MNTITQDDIVNIRRIAAGVCKHTNTGSRFFNDLVSELVEWFWLKAPPACSDGLIAQVARWRIYTMLHKQRRVVLCFSDTFFDEWNDANDEYASINEVMLDRDKLYSAFGNLTRIQQIAALATVSADRGELVAVAHAAGVNPSQITRQSARAITLMRKQLVSRKAA